jgi:hypothetical protein
MGFLLGAALLPLPLLPLLLLGGREGDLWRCCRRSHLNLWEVRNLVGTKWPACLAAAAGARTPPLQGDYSRPEVGRSARGLSQARGELCQGSYRDTSPPGILMMLMSRRSNYGAGDQ